jgi:hypothetical protein
MKVNYGIYVIFLCMICFESQDSSVRRAMDYELDGPGLIPGRVKIFSIPQCSYRLWDPPSLLSSGYRRYIPLVVKRSRREADHSPSSSAEVKNDGDIHPLLLYLHGVMVKAMEAHRVLRRRDFHIF